MFFPSPVALEYMAGESEIAVEFPQFLVVQSLSWVWLFASPRTPAFLNLYYLPKFAQIHVHWMELLYISRSGIAKPHDSSVVFGNKITISKRLLHPQIHCSIIHNSQDSIDLFIDEWIKDLWYVCVCVGVCVCMYVEFYSLHFTCRVLPAYCLVFTYCTNRIIL